MRLKFLSIASIFCAGTLFSWAGKAVADNVIIHTSYPSPYGNHNTIDASGDCSFGTQNNGGTQLVAGGGTVTIGTTTAENNVLAVLNPAGGGAYTAAFRSRDAAALGWGVEIGENNNAGLIQANSANGGAGPLVLNPLGGNVGVNTANPQYPLHISGTLGMGTGVGVLRVSYDTNTNTGYYANYN